MSAKVLTGAVFSVAALSAVTFFFLSNASPYVNVEQAKTTPGDNLHLAGDMDRNTLEVNPQRRMVTFDLIDQDKKRVRVLYEGYPPANMGQATQVVAVGRMENGTFRSHKLLLKCPSKYESETGKGNQFEKAGLQKIGAGSEAPAQGY